MTVIAGEQDSCATSGASKWLGPIMLLILPYALIYFAAVDYTVDLINVASSIILEI